MCNFYAFNWTAGIGVMYANNGGKPTMYGALMVFDSRAERDAWVAADVFDDNWHRKAVDSRTARHIMVDDLFSLGSGTSFVSRWEDRSSAERWAATSELVGAWRGLQADLYPSEA